MAFGDGIVKYLTNLVIDSSGSRSDNKAVSNSPKNLVRLSNKSLNLGWSGFLLLTIDLLWDWENRLDETVCCAASEGFFNFLLNWCFWEYRWSFQLAAVLVPAQVNAKRMKKKRPIDVSGICRWVSCQGSDAGFGRVKAKLLPDAVSKIYLNSHTFSPDKCASVNFLMRFNCLACLI